jgi:serine/threonine protein kinase
MEAIKEAVIEAWPEWQGSVINGVYPLQRMLHGSAHGAVFLTDGKAHGLSAAAIKILRTEEVLTDLQLRHWKAAATLSHPQLIRLLDSGHCEFGGHQCLFVVMEYAEQTLAQVLPHRALTPEEARDMLGPTLQALGFLHRKNLVHGQLKPANFLVVNDQLKLASDTVRTAGEPRASVAQATLYDPPEAKHGRASPAGDMWGLGITLVEALTQCLPWPDEQSGAACVPTTLPAAFVDPLQRCLSRNPASRPTATDLEAHFKRAPQAPPLPAPQAVVREAPARATPARRSPKRLSRVSSLVVPAFLILLVALWGALRVFHGHPEPQQPLTSAAQNPSPRTAGAPAVAAQNPKTLVPASPQVSAASVNAKSRGPKRPPPSAGARQDQPAPADSSLSVIHEQIPVVPRSALSTIRGHIKVTVLVRADRSGNVIDALLENPGPSAYFARLATEAARKWQFAPAHEPDSREWLLRFEFTSSGTTGHATSRS